MPQYATPLQLEEKENPPPNNHMNQKLGFVQKTEDTK